MNSLSRGSGFYWVRTDVGSTHHRLNVTGGPVWGVGAHYKDPAYFKRVGRPPFNPELTSYEWDFSSGDFKPKSFSGYVGVITMAQDIFEDVAAIAKGQFHSHKTFVSDEEYVSIWPKNSLDVIDGDASIYRASASGKLMAPRKLVLQQIPDISSKFFTITFGGIIHAMPVLGQDLREVFERHPTGLQFITLEAPILN